MANPELEHIYHGLQGYTRTLIRDRMVERLTPLLDLELPSGAPMARTVAGIVRVRQEEDLRTVVAGEEAPALFTIEAPGEHPTGRSSTALNYNAPNGWYVTDLGITLIGMAEFDSEKESPEDDVVAPIVAACYRHLLSPDVTLGGACIRLMPSSDGHTGFIYGDQVNFALAFVAPFKWRVQPPGAESA